MRLTIFGKITMTSRFHINSNGDVGNCKAEKGFCPFGSEAEHFNSKQQARETYEKTMERQELKKSNKERIAHLTAEKIDSVYGNYRTTLKSLKGNHAAGRRQKAREVVSDRQKIPVSIVKAVVAVQDEKHGVTHEHTDSYTERLDYDILAAQLVERHGGKKECPNCGKVPEDASVKVRVNPFAAELYEVRQPMLSCLDCYVTVEEDI